MAACISDQKYTRTGLLHLDDEFGVSIQNDDLQDEDRLLRLLIVRCQNPDQEVNINCDGVV